MEDVLRILATFSLVLPKATPYLSPPPTFKMSNASTHPPPVDRVIHVRAIQTVDSTIRDVPNSYLREPTPRGRIRSVPRPITCTHLPRST